MGVTQISLCKKIAVDNNATQMPQGKHKRPRINFGLSDQSKAELEEWAQTENRTVSNLVETIIELALAERRNKPKHHRRTTIASLVTDNYEKLLSMGCIKPERLEALMRGEKPNTSDLTKLAHNLELDEEYIVELRDQSFPQSKRQRRQTNGTT